MLIALASQHRLKWFKSSNAPLLDQVALRIGENDVAHGLVIFDVVGAAAKVAIERPSNGFFEIGARDRLFRQPLQQDLSLIQEPGSAIAALEREVIDDALLQ